MSLLTVQEVAARLRCSLSSVYEMCAAGKLRCLRVGPRRGSIRIRPEDLDVYLAAAESDALGPQTPMPKRTGRPFKHLDRDRLRDAWRRQGALADPPGERSTPSSE